MQRIDPAERASSRRRDVALFAALAAAAAIVPSLAMWGFTVDDALISVRYACNVAAGHGYTFSAGSPPSDGVTPLPWVPVLVALSAGSATPWSLLFRAKVLGVSAHVASTALLGARIAADVRTSRDRVVACASLALLALAFPVAAWAASGMETGLATSLATLAAVSFERPRRVAVLAGSCAALRPEMLPWSLVVVGAAWALRPPGAVAPPSRVARLAGLMLGGAIALVPFALCVAIRLSFFGRPMPLSVLAKPSDLEHGVAYAGAAAVVALLPFVAAAPLSLVQAHAGGRARALAAAACVHVAAVAVAGGDWMPFARLVVPIVPSLVLVVTDVGRRGRGFALASRAALSFALGIVLTVRAAPGGRGVMRDRGDLVARARPVLADARVVAALDVGWVSASTGARIVDLAGLTDPSIAVLPGGHTSKRVDVAMLLDRHVDTVVLYTPPRAVEARLSGSPLFAEHYVALADLPLGSRGASYAVYRLRSETDRR